MVKFAPGFSDITLGRARHPDTSTAAGPDQPGTYPADLPIASICKCKRTSEQRAPQRSRTSPRCPRNKPSTGLIPTGTLAGRPRSPEADRSRALDLRQVRLLVNAHMFASGSDIARPLNTLLTIVWRRSAQWLGVESWPQLQGRFLDQATRWLQRQGIATAFVWTRETRQGTGPHTHVALHLGARPIEVRDPFLRWAEGAFAFDADGVRLTMGRYGAMTPRARAGILRYLLKGIDHRQFQYCCGEALNTAAELGIENRGPQGIVTIKRAGTSQNIAPTARRRAAWPERRSIAELSRHLQPAAAPMQQPCLKRQSQPRPPATASRPPRAPGRATAPPAAAPPATPKSRRSTTASRPAPH